MTVIDCLALVELWFVQYFGNKVQSFEQALLLVSEQKMKILFVLACQLYLIRLQLIIRIEDTVGSVNLIHHQL